MTGQVAVERLIEDERLWSVAKFLCGYFSPHAWEAVADDKRELRILVRNSGRDINENTKEDFREVAFALLTQSPVADQISSLSAEKAALEQRAVLTQQAGDAANEGLRKQLAEARGALEECHKLLDFMGGEGIEIDGFDTVQLYDRTTAALALPAEQGEE